MTHFTIREAVPHDCIYIMKLVQELADFEKMSDQVKISHEVLQRDGFGEHKFFRCLVAEAPGGVSDIVGYALYFFNYSTWEGRMLYLEDLYVTPEFRGKGIGTTLWQKVAKVGLDYKCVRLQFSVLNWNTKAIELYKSKGAVDLTVKEKWHIFRMNEQEMKNFVESLK